MLLILMHHSAVLSCTHHRLQTRRYLNVSNNELEGALPVLPTGLVSVDISSNKLSGSLPADMSTYAALVDIQVRTEQQGQQHKHHELSAWQLCR